MKPEFVSTFTPSLMSGEALEAIFVQREALAGRLVDLIRDSVLTPSKHHMLLVGPRGIGKTHLVSLVYHRVQAMEDLRDRLVVAWLREEEWGVSSFVDLLLRIWRSLPDDGTAGELTARMESVYDLPPAAAERVAGETLRQRVGDRALLVIAENLDATFAGLGDEGQKRWRAYLQEHPFCTILATSQSLFNGVSLQTSPFYGFFSIHHLEELTFEGAVDLLAKIATHTGDQELASFIGTPAGRARIRAVHHLAGGNHRVYVIFSQFLTREALDELVDAVMKTLDELTPYYQSRMSWVSPQQRKIVAFLCERAGAVPVKDIAHRLMMSEQTASGQLRSLRELGYVQSVPVGRESYYELRERLMRLCVDVKRHRAEPVGLLVSFLQAWYSRKELSERLQSLAPGDVMERTYIERALEGLAETGDPRVEACVADLRARLNEGNHEAALQAAEELVEVWDDPQGHLLHGGLLAQCGRPDEALAAVDKARDLGAEDRGVMERTLVWFVRGLALGALDRLDDALESCNKAIESDPTQANTWRLHARILSRLNRHDEALASCDKAISLGTDDWRAFHIRAASLAVLNRWDEALGALPDALHRGACVAQRDASATVRIVQELVCNADQTTWRERVSRLIEVYGQENALVTLGLGLLACVPDLGAETPSPEEFRTWCALWQELGKGKEALVIPLRVLGVVGRLQGARDAGELVRELLQVSQEERAVLRQALGIEGEAER